jgi:hypothetical protein
MKTFKQIRHFNIAADSFYKRDPKNSQTKLGYAINKLSDVQIANVIKEYQKTYGDLFSEMVEKKHIDHALTDKITGALLTSPKGSDRPFLFDKEGLKQVITAEKAFKETWEKEAEAFDLKEFDIKPHITGVVPEDLTDQEKEGFAGFVIEEEVV